MDYSRHDIYTCNHVGFSKFPLLHPLEKRPDRCNLLQIYHFFLGSLVSVKSNEKVTSTQEQVQQYCNWRKEALLRL